MTLLPFQASLQAEHFCNLSPLLSSPASYKCWWTDYYLAVYFMYLKGVYAPSFLCWAISIPSVFPHNSCYLDICSFSLLPEDLPPVVSHLSWGYFSWTSSSIEWSRRMSIWLLWLPSCTSSQSDVCLGESTTSPIHLQLVIPCGPYVVYAGLLYTQLFPILSVCSWLFQAKYRSLHLFWLNSALQLFQFVKIVLFLSSDVLAVSTSLI